MAQPMISWLLSKCDERLAIGNLFLQNLHSLSYGVQDSSMCNMCYARGLGMRPGPYWCQLVTDWCH